MTTVMLHDIVATMVFVDKPTAPKAGAFRGAAQQEPRYSAVLRIKKGTPAAKELFRVINEECAAEGLRFADIVGQQFVTVRDGDKDPLAAKYADNAGHWVIRVSTKDRPTILNPEGKVTVETGLFQSRYENIVSVQLNVKVYPGNRGQEGVSCFLNAIQYRRQGEPVGNAVDLSGFRPVVDPREPEPEPEPGHLEPGELDDDYFG